MRLFIILFGSLLFSYGQEKVLFFQTDWANQLSWDAFCVRAKVSGYDGVDLGMFSDPYLKEVLKERLKLNK
ncbi:MULTISPECIES: hypothetical protein [Arenibacter]|uniref:hypothetical protein n=1 Tax=Arenibacter TaxID=178469 RepID=UPI0018654783|nr:MULTISPECIES: hypothetical protein [Arenibacter]